MVTIALCDDNEIQIDMCKDIIEDYIESKGIDAKVKVFYNGEELISYVKENGFFDIYILDMIMPKINGLETASTLRLLKDEGKIIFLTSTVEYAVSSYDVKAFYYMLKPLDGSKLCKILDSAIEELEEENKSILVLKTSEGDVHLNISDIMYVDIVDRCPTYHVRDGREISDRVLRGSFKDSVSTVVNWGGFYFCGVSMVINSKYVDVIDSQSILIKDGTVLYPAKSGISEFKKNMKSG